MMDRQEIIFRDLGLMEYQAAWDYQERLLKENVAIKSNSTTRQIDNRQLAVGQLAVGSPPSSPDHNPDDNQSETVHYLLFTEHPPVYTLGKSGKMENVLLGENELKEKEIAFFHTNRGGDITFHGPGQIVGYPILDLEKFTTDIGKYLRNLEEVIILTLAAYGIKGVRSAGETGVWIDAGIPGRERKICAIGVRCSRWITMHGFAFNVNTDLRFFNHIIPCGISNKQVTSLAKELGYEMDAEEVKNEVKKNFEKVFEAVLV